jgi:hypothetical protein
MSEPERTDYPTHDAYIEAMCKHLNIPVWITKQLPADVYATAEEVWKSINNTSEPKVQRWECECNGFGDADMQKNNNGNYVRYEDYVSLKAENNRLKQLNKKIMSTADVIDANNQRLIKAGDGLCASAYLWETDPAVLRWNAAKEGKQS